VEDRAEHRDHHDEHHGEHHERLLTAAALGLLGRTLGPFVVLQRPAAVVRLPDPDALGDLGDRRPQRLQHFQLTASMMSQARSGRQVRLAPSVPRRRRSL
jgi:hypothetical protein